MLLVFELRKGCKEDLHSKHLILLSATPEQLGLEGHFGRLKLLDPNKFSDLELIFKDLKLPEIAPSGKATGKKFNLANMANKNRASSLEQWLVSGQGQRWMTDRGAGAATTLPGGKKPVGKGFEGHELAKLTGMDKYFELLAKNLGRDKGLIAAKPLRQFLDRVSGKTGGSARPGGTTAKQMRAEIAAKLVAEAAKAAEEAKEKQPEHQLKNQKPQKPKK